MGSLDRLSQTCLKHFEEGCPKKWEGMWIKKEIPFFSNEKMDMGSYFEYLCLGGGATEDEVTDLPRLKNGNKSKSHIRLEEQVLVFKELFNKDSESFLGFTIDEDQIVIFNDDKTERGVIDFSTDKKTIWDLKLTGDVHAKRHPKHWGQNDEDLDVTQAIFYADLWEKKHGYRPVFKYIIFDYSPRKGIKIVTVNTSDEDIKNLDRRKEEVYEGVELYSKIGYEREPALFECSSCPLECNVREYEFKYLDKMNL